jgi:hypothetical protein
MLTCHEHYKIALFCGMSLPLNKSQTVTMVRDRGGKYGDEGGEYGESKMEVGAGCMGMRVGSMRKEIWGRGTWGRGIYRWGGIF